MRTTVLLAIACLAATPSYTHPGAHDHAPSHSVELNHPVTTGNGRYLYQTVPHWGSLPDSQLLGPTHGGVAVAPEGKVYVSTDSERGICVYSADGTFLKSIAPHSPGIHSLALRNENGAQYLYGAHLQGQRILKLDTSGEIVLKIEHSESNSIPGALKGLTAVAVGPDGRIYAAVGYGSNHVHIFSPKGELLKTFGSRSDEPGGFKTCHGVAIDTRFDVPAPSVSTAISAPWPNSRDA